MSAVSPNESSNHPGVLAFELPVRREHRFDPPLLFKGQPLEGYELKSLMTSLVVPESWDKDRLYDCLSVVMYVMLAAIVKYDEGLAVQVEEEGDTGTICKESCLSVLVSEAKQSTLSLYHDMSILTGYGDLIRDTEGLRQAMGARLRRIPLEDLGQLCKHLGGLGLEEQTFLLQYTWAHCAPKLKWEQCKELEGIGGPPATLTV